MSSHRSDALRAIQQALVMLDLPEPFDGFRISLLRAGLRYAVSEVEAIQEVKRVRKGVAGASSRGGHDE